MSDFIKCPEPRSQYLSGHYRLSETAATGASCSNSLSVVDSDNRSLHCAGAFQFRILERLVLDLGVGTTLNDFLYRGVDFLKNRLRAFIALFTSFILRRKLLPKINNYHQPN